MSEEKWIMGIAEAVEDVRDLQNQIESKPYLGHSRLWSGADVKILDKNILFGQNDSPFNEYVKIKTPYSKELSWGLYQMRDIFYKQKLIDGISKYQFFGRLAEAAYKYHKIYGDGNEKDLLKEISNEAMSILKDMFKTTKHGIS